MKRAGQAALVVLLASLIGCYSNTIEPSPPPGPSASATTRPTVRPTPTPVGTEAPQPDLTGLDSVGGLVSLGMVYRCETVPFSPDLLFQPGNAELDPDPAAFALRQFLAGRGADFDLMPETGWRRAGTAFGNTEFVNNAKPPAPAGTFVWARVEPKVDGWQVGAWGDCQPQRVPEAPLQSLGWWLPNGRPGADATTLDTLVAVDGCNSGSQPEDVLEPAIIETEASVVVILSAQPSAGGCPPLPPGQILAPTRLLIALPAPIGVRAALDGSQFPPRSALDTPRGYGGIGG